MEDKDQAQPKNSEETQSPELEQLHISDDDLETTDQIAESDKKEAKKRAKLLLSPEEKKRRKIKKIIIGSLSSLAVIILLLIVPVTRFAILNFLGFRASLSLTVQESSGDQKISDASVLLDDQTIGSTDANGHLESHNIRLGHHSIIAQKSGYSTEQQKTTFGLGTTDKTISLKAIGVKVSISVKDWLSNKPVAGAKVTTKSSKSTTDKTGLAAVIVPPENNQNTITVSAKGYQTQKINIDQKVTSKEVSLLTDAKDYFISKRDGNFDIFSSNIDGSQQKKIIEASGKENQNIMQFAVNRNNQQAILVANRLGLHEGDSVVAEVYRVDLQQAKLTKIDSGSNIQLIDWAHGDSLVYTKTNPALHYDDKNLTQLMVYNVASGSLSELSSGNYFQVASVVANSIFYLPGDAYHPQKGLSLTSLDVVTNQKRQYLANQAISYATQARYGILQLQTNQSKFYEINALSGSVTQISNQPGDNKQFALNQASDSIAYADKRDGKGALIINSILGGKERTVARIAGLTNPIRWIDSNHVIARIATNQETADYVIEVNTGKFTKIVDVSNVGQSGLY